MKSISCGVEPTKLGGFSWQGAGPAAELLNLRRPGQAIGFGSPRSEAVARLRGMFDAPDRKQADRRLKLAVQKIRKTAPELAGRMTANVPEGLTVFMLPPQRDEV